MRCEGVKGLKILFKKEKHQKQNWWWCLTERNKLKNKAAQKSELSQNATCQRHIPSLRRSVTNLERFCPMCNTFRTANEAQIECGEV